MKLAANIIAWLVGIGLFFFVGSLFYARWEQRRWDRMDVDRKLRYFLKKRGGKL